MEECETHISCLPTSKQEKSSRRKKRKLSQRSGNYKDLIVKGKSEKVIDPLFERPTKIIKKWWILHASESIIPVNIHSSATSHESKKELPSFPTESDDVVRSANIYLCLQHVDSMPEFLKEYDWTKHWILVFEFDNRIISFEVAQSIEGKKGNLIKPSFKDDYVIEVIKPPYFIQTIQTSPKRVRDAAANNRYNNKKYLAGTQNCQEWIKDLCKTLNVTNFNLGTFKDTVPLLALAANSSSPIIKQMFANFHTCYSYCSKMSNWDLMQYLYISVPVLILYLIPLYL